MTNTYLVQRFFRPKFTIDIFNFHDGATQFYVYGFEYTDEVGNYKREAGYLTHHAALRAAVAYKRKVN